jgi:cadmium resistance transport/sequestration family protein
MIETIITAIIAFASSNVDDLFILMMLFSQTSTTGLTARHIFAGQYFGIISLTTFSLLGSLLGIIIPVAYIGLLGLFPIYLGIVKLYRYLKKDNEKAEEIILEPRIKEGSIMAFVAGANTLNIAAITIANGGDNIGIYIPLFANLSVPELVITVAVFLILVYVWLIVSRYLVSHPGLREAIRRYNSVVFPFILIVLGIYILVESGTTRLLQ